MSCVGASCRLIDVITGRKIDVNYDLNITSFFTTRKTSKNVKKWSFNDLQDVKKTSKSSHLVICKTS